LRAIGQKSLVIYESQPYSVLKNEKIEDELIRKGTGGTLSPQRMTWWYLG